MLIIYVLKEVNKNTFKTKYKIKPKSTIALKKINR